ncbi:Hsp20/alpha crystallin family protein [Prauserella cavernicola]|uniref:Hsp20/alpha crystallin family protein n=1 Tax=Prauserella cavernicola TaxID=2800127 RepID=A0A934V5B2_9PSEU|nr:Hsp20/alpha crystallin family protein [Prauserella cavernicola]MBK1786297.1 Hsp20/alpha crystallin family protein [Prauserella cavernicola]
MTQPAARTSRPLASWDPFRDFDDVYRRLGLARLEQNRAWAPAADVSETDDAYVVDVEVPGVARDDITVDVSERRLTISGEVTAKEREGRLRHRTRRTGQFRYAVTLPRGVEQDSIAAELADGVLTVRVPKSASATPRRIEISEKSEK